MRGDMPKVIVERRRLGGAKLAREKFLGDDERTLSKVGVKRHAKLRGGSKMLNENLNPLRRYLEAQVGRPWDKVWAEVCENLKPSNTVQQHVRDHIPDFVAMKTTLRDGEVWINEPRKIGPLKGSFVKLYVDPKSGLLRRNKYWDGWRRRRREAVASAAKARAQTMRVVSPTKQFHLLEDGAWWEVTLAAVPTGVEAAKTRFGPRRVTFEKPVDDVVLRAGLSTLSREDLYGRRGVYAASKRQLSKKEMRALKLR